jgi:hypothetical protein
MVGVDICLKILLHFCVAGTIRTNGWRTSWAGGRPWSWRPRGARVATSRAGNSPMLLLLKGRGQGPPALLVVERLPGVSHLGPNKCGYFSSLISCYLLLASCARVISQFELCSSVETVTLRLLPRAKRCVDTFGHERGQVS